MPVLLLCAAKPTTKNNDPPRMDVMKISLAKVRPEAKLNLPYKGQIL
jgi:hypothetical protein